MKKQIKPTESELAILQILWQAGPQPVRVVNELLSSNSGSEIGYTTTLKLMQIMFEKGLVTRDSSSKTHIYEAAVTREKTQKQFVSKMINSLFSGSSAALVMQALGNNNSSKDKKKKIQVLLNELKAKK